MSVDKWYYHPDICDGNCPGDCDLCDIPKNPPEELIDDEIEEEIKREIEDDDEIEREIKALRKGEE